MAFRRLIVAIEFDGNLTTHAIQRSASLSKDGENAIVLGLDVRPHLSLYHLMVRENSEVEILQNHLRKLVEPLRQFDVMFTQVKQATPGWIFWNAEDGNEMLQKTHELIVANLASCRDADVKIDWPMNETQQAMHQKWGYPNVMDGFHAHITLAKLPPEQVPSEYVSGMPFVMMGIAERIVIYEAGEDGTCARVEASIELRE